MIPVTVAVPVTVRESSKREASMKAPRDLQSSVHDSRAPLKKTSGGMGEQFQRRYWNPHWIRVAGEDEAMKIGPWIARKRKAFWEARFAVAVANCNAGMISRSQHI